MNNYINLESYNDTENLDRFNENTLEPYMKMKLESAELDANFIIENIAKPMGREKISACEIGSGNGKLMYLLERMGALSRGVNYEVSKSRYSFAEVFKDYVGSTLVENRNEDVLKSKDDNKYDCIIAVDIVTQFITCLYDTAEDDYFKWINRHLSLGGYAFFEMESYRKERKMIEETGEPVRRWEEFPENDPFQYGLYEVNRDEDKNIVFKKLFYERATGMMSGFTNVIKPYDEDQFVDLLNKYGFAGEIRYKYKEQGDLPNKLYLCLAKKVKDV